MSIISKRYTSHQINSRIIRVKWIIIISLILAASVHIIRRLYPNKNTHKEKNALKLVIPQAQSFSAKDKNQPPCYTAYRLNQQGKKEAFGFCFLTTDIAPEIKGYAGAIKIMLGMNNKAELTGIKIIEHHETPSYAAGINSGWFKKQFKGKKITDPFKIDDDIDGISQATITVSAIAQAIKKSGLRLANARLGMQIPELKENPWEDINYLNLIFLLILIGCTLLNIYLNNNNLRYMILISAVILLGFYHTNALSAVNLVNIITFRLPPLIKNVFWYILIAFTILSCLIGGRIYCGFMCPFGAILELLEKLKIYRLKISSKTEYRSKYVKYIILWLIVIAALLLNDANVADYEPFTALFAQSGNVLHRVFLVIVILYSLFIPRFFCRYLCAIGAALGCISHKSPKRLRIKDKCTQCKKCLKACPYQAIETDKEDKLYINAIECIQCQACINVCPHKAISR